MNICMKEFISFVELRQLFPYMAFVYAWIVCAFMGLSTPTTAFDGAIWYFADTM